MKVANPSTYLHNTTLVELLILLQLTHLPLRLFKSFSNQEGILLIDFPALIWVQNLLGNQSKNLSAQIPPSDSERAANFIFFHSLFLTANTQTQPPTQPIQTKNYIPQQTVF